VVQTITGGSSSQTLCKLSHQAGFFTNFNHMWETWVLSLRRRGAAQRGAQISDMTHLLHSIDSFAKIRIATSYRHIRSSRG